MKKLPVSARTIPGYVSVLTARRPCNYELLIRQRLERSDHQRMNGRNYQASNLPKPGTGAWIFSVRITHHNAAAVEATTGSRVSFSNSCT